MIKPGIPPYRVGNVYQAMCITHCVLEQINAFTPELCQRDFNELYFVSNIKERFQKLDKRKI